MPTTADRGRHLAEPARPLHLDTGDDPQAAAGGFRGLGDLFIINSTVSGNTSTAWHGGGGFFTDGVTDVLNTTIVGNVAPVGTAGGLFVGTFTDAAATLNVTNGILASGANLNCFLAPFGAGPVALNSGGNTLPVTQGRSNSSRSFRMAGSKPKGPAGDPATSMSPTQFAIGCSASCTARRRQRRNLRQDGRPRQARVSEHPARHAIDPGLLFCLRCGGTFKRLPEKPGHRP